MAALLGTATPAAAQIQTFLTTKVARAWRRPLSQAEMAALTKIFNDAAPDGAARGFHLVMEAALQAPSFLYRTEVGMNAAASKDPVQLTPFELASALSFLFTETAPDDTLWMKAQAGNLADPTVLAAEVDRLMKLPQAKTNMTLKAGYWLGLAGIANRGRNSKLYPEWNETIKASLGQSVQLFLADIVGTGKLADLFTSNRVYVNQQLGQLYGIPGAMGTALVPVAVAGTQRSAGILTQPGMIVAANKSSDRGDVVHRGLMIHEAFVCGAPIPPAPPEAGDEAKKMDGTERERSEARGMKAACRPCHGQFDIRRASPSRSTTPSAASTSTARPCSTPPPTSPPGRTAQGHRRLRRPPRRRRGDGVAGPGERRERARRQAGERQRARGELRVPPARRILASATTRRPRTPASSRPSRNRSSSRARSPDFFRALALSPGFRTRNPLPPPQK
jgi:hypothetical protein